MAKAIKKGIKRNVTHMIRIPGEYCRRKRHCWYRKKNKEMER